MDGTRLQLPDNVKIILETTDLEKASPSLLFRAVCNTVMLMLIMMATVVVMAMLAIIHEGNDRCWRWHVQHLTEPKSVILALGF